MAMNVFGASARRRPLAPLLAALLTLLLAAGPPRADAQAPAQQLSLAGIAPAQAGYIAASLSTRHVFSVPKRGGRVCAILASGRLFCYDFLGGNTFFRSPPTGVGATRFVSVEVTDTQILALLDNGFVCVGFGGGSSWG